MTADTGILKIVAFCYNSMSIVTWFVLIFGMMKTVQAFIKAYAVHETYDQMKLDKDKTSITQFYYGVIISMLCVFVFFLPYLMEL